MPYGASTNPPPAVLLFDTDSPPHKTTSPDEVARRAFGGARMCAVFAGRFAGATNL